MHSFLFRANGYIAGVLDLLIESRERYFKDLLLHLRLKFLIAIRGTLKSISWSRFLLIYLRYALHQSNYGSRFSSFEARGDIPLLDYFMIHQALAV